MNSTRLNIAIEVDDKGTVKIRQLGKTAEKAGAKAEKGFKRAGRTLGDYTERAAKAAKATALIVGAGVTAGLVAMTAAMKKAVGLANEQEKVETRLAAVLKATGNASGYNIEQLKAMASSMQNVTTVGDEVILSGMGILATFKNVRGEGFERATMAALDMSNVMGTDLNSSITQIGKALNDPIQGLTALSRVGVTFTDQQKEQIKVLQASGDMMSAQNIILKELESEFGGAASAAVKDFDGKVSQLSNSYGDMWEQLGFTITKSDEFKSEVDSLRQEVEKFTAYIEAHREAIGSFFAGGLEAVNTLIDKTREAAAAMQALRDLAHGVITIQQYLSLDPAELLNYSKVRLAIHEIADAEAELAKAKSNLAVKERLSWLVSSKSIETARARVKELSEQVAYLKKWRNELAKGEGAVNNVATAYKQFAGAADVAGLAAAEAAMKTQKNAKKTAKIVCEAHRQELTCAQKATVKAVEYDIKYHKERYRNTDMFVGKIEADKRAAEMIKAQEQATNEAINADLETAMNERDDLYGLHAEKVNQLQQNMVNDLGRMGNEYINKILTGQINTAGDLIKGLFDSIRDQFFRLVAQLASNSLVELIFGNGSSGGQTLGSALSSLFGGDGSSGGGGSSNVTSLIPSSGLGSGIHDWVATNVSEGAADGLATLASGAAMVGGAYGMYSGVNNMAHGNVAVGAAQTGVGGYSMYQGAVGLDLVPEGTATQFASDVAGYLGYNGGQTTVEPYVSGQVYQQLGSEIGKTAGQEIGVSLANNGSGLTTGIGSGMGMLSSYAGAGSAAAGEGTMLAAQGMYSGVGASGIGSGAGMMSSYAGAGAGAEMGSASMAGPMGIIAAVGIAMNSFLPKIPDLIAESTRKESGIGLGTPAEHSELLSGDYSAIDMSNYAKKWKDVFSGIAETAMSDFGGLSDMTQQLGQNMDTTHVQQYLSTLAGVNVSMADTATTMQLAHEAAQGNETAFNQLYETLNGVMAATGDSTEYASASAYGLVDAMIAAGEATDATVGQLDGVSESFYTAQNAADSLASAMVDSGIATQDTADQISEAYGSGIEAVEQYVQHMNGLDDEWLSSSDVMDEVKAAAAGGSGALQTLIHDIEGTGIGSTQAAQAAQAMTNAVRKFSSTNLDLEATARLNVEIQGAANMSSSISGSSSLSSDRYFDPYDRYGDAEGSALGGVVERPTWFTPFNYFGEAGPEAITPLRHPKQINHIEDKIDKLGRYLELLGQQVIKVENKLVVELDGKKIDARARAEANRVFDRRNNRGGIGQHVF